MPAKSKFDAIAGRKYFAAHCSNKAWDLIAKVKRTPEEDRLVHESFMQKNNPGRSGTVVVSAIDQSLGTKEEKRG